MDRLPFLIRLYPDRNLRVILGQDRPQFLLIKVFLENSISPMTEAH